MPEEKLYYAIGELAYAIAKSDGDVQHSEFEALKEIMIKHPIFKQKNMDVTEIIFQVLDAHEFDWKRAYKRALSEIKDNKEYLNQGLKKGILDLLNEVALAYNGVEPSEAFIIKALEAEFKTI